MSRIGEIADPRAEGGRRAALTRATLVTVKGPKGTLTQHLAPDHDHCAGRRRDAACSARDDSRQPLAARPDPHPAQQHGRRRDDRLPQEPG